jgi:dihydroneopterin aldolase
MAEIRLEGMSFFAHHGYYTHEQVRGNHYTIDVSVETDIEEAAIHDDLHETINYEIIYRICHDVMEHPCKLIETVAYRIAHEIRKTFPHTQHITVSIHKLKPELGGPVQGARVIYKLD